MEEYINKAVVKTELEKRLKHNGTRVELDKSAFMAGREKEDEDILAFLDTLEVKEVDLGIEVALWANAIPEIRLDDIERLAKYFYELGFKAKGE